MNIVKSPLVSIIVPIYNVENYLERCLESLLNQTVREIEVLCIDDGSSDASSLILDQYAAKDTRIVAIHQKNQGLAVARNVGLDIARGKWVMGVDSDDWLELDTIEKVLAVASDDVDIVWFGIKVITDKGESHNPYYDAKYCGKVKVIEQIIRNTNVNFCAKLWRSELIQERTYRFYPGLWYEDNYFFYTVAPNARNIYYLEDKLYCRYMRSDSIMGKTLNAKPVKAIDQLITRGLIFEYYQKNGLPSIFGQISPSPMELFLLRSGYNFSYNHMPTHSHGRLRKEASKIIHRYHFKRYMLECGYMMHQPVMKRLFVLYGRHSITYKFFGISIYKIRVKNNKLIKRFLGVKISEKEYINT